MHATLCRYEKTQGTPHLARLALSHITASNNIIHILASRTSMYKVHGAIACSLQFTARLDKFAGGYNGLAS